MYSFLRAVWTQMYVGCYVFQSNLNDLETDVFDAKMVLLLLLPFWTESEPGSNSNEGVVHTPQISRTRASLSDAV